MQDFTQVDGKPGYFRHALQVYANKGACHTCGKPIRHLVQGQRSSYYLSALPDLSHWFLSASVLPGTHQKLRGEAVPAGARFSNHIQAMPVSLEQKFDYYRPVSITR